MGPPAIGLQPEALSDRLAVSAAVANGSAGLATAAVCFRQLHRARFACRKPPPAAEDLAKEVEAPAVVLAQGPSDDSVKSKMDRARVSGVASVVDNQVVWSGQPGKERKGKES